MAKVDQRDALEVLTRVRLIDLAQGFGLDVSKRGNKDELIDVLARSRRASYEAILGVLSRKELEEICWAYGLSDKGKDKAGLIDRILGRSGKVMPLARVTEPKKRGQGNKKKVTKAAASEKGKKARGPLQPLVDELKRNYCREVLAESSSMSAAARVAGFTPRGFQLMLRKQGIEATEVVAKRKRKGVRGPLRPLVDELKRNYCREVLEESSSMSAAAGVAGFTPRGFQVLLAKLGIKAERAVNDTGARGPLQSVVDELKRNYCLELLGESSSMSAAARVAGFTPRGFQLMLRNLGIKAKRAGTTKRPRSSLQSLADELERHCRELLEESSSLPVAAKAAGFTARGFQLLLKGLGMKAEQAANEKRARGPLQPLVDEIKRDYCRGLLAESPSLTAAARVAGFTPRGFQLLLRRLGMKAADYLGR